MKRWTTVLAGALTLTVGLVVAPVGVYADHHEGGHSDSGSSMSGAAEQMEGQAEDAAASMEEKAEASATDAADKMEGEAKKAMKEGSGREGSH